MLQQQLLMMEMWLKRILLHCLTRFLSSAAQIHDQKQQQMQLNQRLLSMERPEEQLEKEKVPINELELEIKEQKQR